MCYWTPCGLGKKFCCKSHKPKITTWQRRSVCKACLQNNKLIRLCRLNCNLRSPTVRLSLFLSLSTKRGLPSVQLLMVRERPGCPSPLSAAVAFSTFKKLFASPYCHFIILLNEELSVRSCLRVKTGLCDMKLGRMWFGLRKLVLQVCAGQWMSYCPPPLDRWWNFTGIQYIMWNSLSCWVIGNLESDIFSFFTLAPFHLSPPLNNLTLLIPMNTSSSFKAEFWPKVRLINYANSELLWWY